MTGKKHNIKLPTKIILLITFIACCIGLSSTFLVSRIMHRAMEEELEEKTSIIAKSLAERVSADVIDGQVIPVREALQEIKLITEDVVFAYIVGFDDEIFAHSFGGGMPRLLVSDRHRLIYSDAPESARYSTGEGPVLAVGHPLIDGMRAHIHIGMSEQLTHDQISNLRNQVIGLTLGVTLLGIVLGIVLSRRITYPLRHLADSMRSFGEGEKEKEIDLRGGGAEVAELIHSFNRMISQRTRADKALRKAKRELERQNVALSKLDKMKDGLIRDVSHELKTPVAKHAMQVEILKGILGEQGLVGETKQTVDIMEAAIKRQNSVIRNILSLSQLEAGGRKYKVEPVLLDELLMEVVEDYRAAMESYGIRAGIHLEAVTVTSDQEMLWHVFSNLVNNAVKYRKESGPAEIDIFLEREEKEARIRIRDNGIGLSQEEKERVFDRFYQASPPYEGIGAGLTISKMIVEELGGRIWIESDGKGEGVTAVVTVPL